MSIWKKPADLAAMNKFGSNFSVGLLGIEFTEVGPDYLVARMPVEPRTQQPFGLLHGGVSCVLAETMGSMGAWLAADEGFTSVGTDINASHLRAVRSGWVTGTARPIRIGRRMQFWSIDIADEDGNAVCAARLTVAIIKSDW
jgi:1,4-dihydroxy-2-naphthoyl-CoA hydrolase